MCVCVCGVCGDNFQVAPACLWSCLLLGSISEKSCYACKFLRAREKLKKKEEERSKSRNKRQNPRVGVRERQREKEAVGQINS